MATRRKGDTAMPSQTDRSTRSRLRALSWLLASGAALLGAWPQGVGAVQALQTYDLDRVEVLRGPQGTLYGKNATGGAISFYTKNPSLTAYDGYITAGAGNYSAYSVQGAVGGPVIDNEIGWRAAVMYEKRDGWVRSRSEEHTSELQSRLHLVCRLLLEKKKKNSQSIL